MENSDLTCWINFELQTCTVSQCLAALTCTFEDISASSLSVIIFMPYSLPLCTVYRSRTTMTVDVRCSVSLYCFFSLYECAFSFYFLSHWKKHQMILCYFFHLLCGWIACLLAFSDEKWLQCRKLQSYGFFGCWDYKLGTEFPGGHSWQRSVKIR